MSQPYRDNEGKPVTLVGYPVYECPEIDPPPGVPKRAMVAAQFGLPCECESLLGRVRSAIGRHIAREVDGEMLALAARRPDRARGKITIVDGSFLDALHEALPKDSPLRYKPHA